MPFVPEPDAKSEQQALLSEIEQVCAALRSLIKPREPQRTASNDDERGEMTDAEVEAVLQKMKAEEQVAEKPNIYDAMW